MIVQQPTECANHKMNKTWSFRRFKSIVHASTMKENGSMNLRENKGLA